MADDTIDSITSMLHPALLTALCYSSVYLLVKSTSLFKSLPPTARIDACSRVPSFVNVGVCLFATFVLFDDIKGAFWDLEAAAFNSSSTRDFYLHLCSGYMVYDLGLMMASFQTLGDTAMILHHLVVISALQTGVIFQAGTFYMTVLFINEFSTIFVNFRFMFLHYDMSDSKAYFYNGVALATSFFIVRIIAIIILLLHVACNWWFVAYKKGLFWSRPRSDRLLFGGLTLLLMVHGALNMFWFWKIVQHVLRASKRQTKEVSMKKE